MIHPGIGGIGADGESLVQWTDGCRGAEGDFKGGIRSGSDGLLPAFDDGATTGGLNGEDVQRLCACIAKTKNSFHLSTRSDWRKADVSLLKLNSAEIRSDARCRGAGQS